MYPDAPLGTIKSCTNCPNLVQRHEVEKINGRSINADVCLVKGYVLGTPGMQPKAREKLHEAKANGCGSYGKAAANKPHATFMVAMPDFERDITTKMGAVPACRGCINFIPEQHVMKLTGWNAGLCAAKGTLIPLDKLTSVARNCSTGVLGPSTAHIEQVRLFGEYETAFGGEMTVLETMLKGLEIPDPLDYESDAPVSDDSKKEGIIAWRHVYSEEDKKKFVALPIFSPDAFTEAERATIPRVGDDEKPELYMDHDGLVYKVAALWLGLGETPALWGMPGVGKTELCRHLAWLMQVPFTRLSITASTEIDEIIGKMMYDPERGTFFQKGRLPNAYIRPGVVCIDEPNTGPVEVWQRIRPLIDNSKQMVIDEADGERLTKHAYCHMVLAMNPAWDHKNVGALQIGAADASRLMHVTVDLPPEEVERQIIQARVKSDGWEIEGRILDTIMRIAKDIRSNSDNFAMTWGIREQIKVARASRFYPIKTVYRVAAGDYMDAEGRQALANIVNSHVR